MNYIKQLNAAFEKFFFDDRLNPTHISLYMALFHEWNSSRFASEFFVNRRELMRVAKIGSKSTYHRCIVELDKWDYLSYFPSSNPYKGSKIKMAIIETSDEPDMGQYNPKLEQLAERYHPIREPVVYPHHPTNGQAVYQHRPVSGQALVSNINNTKQVNINKQPKDRQAVLYFFKEKGFSADEGKKFFEHYQERDWKTSDENEVRDWRALAINWMDRAELYGSENSQTKKGASHNRDNLKTTKIKDYGQPL
ncbi:hypothetical protein RM549_18590 [Salegentibacter sp. F188]|uniref:Transcriptional regulator n=2 Tax=Autumnicola TaxID=3160927 RepID=A0ABU3E736_9FLAO|nr:MULTISPECIES: hypothetical protein [Flavobacteriaceae]MDT0687354.1 hypothetical protein [Zunongwangia sp. F225]MDT0691807.1 hypothetical protein [Salegentibacter sp. F188]